MTENTPANFRSLRLTGRIVLILAAVLVFLTLLLAGYDAAASAQAVIDYPPPGEFVTVNGAQMHYVCQGEGVPTLVLQAGYGGGALDWLPLMDALDDDYRVCAFDRFGQDYSDPMPEPRTFATAADELHLALEALGISNPVVIGHSLGGAVVQDYAARYDAAGVVLVDGLTLDVAEAVVARMGSYQALTPLAQLGVMRPAAGAFIYPAYGDALHSQMLALRARSTTIVQMAVEGALAAEQVPALLESAESTLATLPMLVIAAGATDVPEAGFAESLAAFAERVEATYFVVSDAGHYVMATHTDETAAILLDWLATAVE